MNFLEVLTCRYWSINVHLPVGYGRAECQMKRQDVRPPDLYTSEFSYDVICELQGSKIQNL
jgi:hypothetical protein